VMQMVGKGSVLFFPWKEGQISDLGKMGEHIERFYKQLFGKKDRGAIRLVKDFLETSGYLSDEEAVGLVESFSEKEIKATLDEMKIRSAPGLDWLPIEFYKCFWEQIKDPGLEMFEKFHRRDLNLSRLNYGLISLIPKLKEANSINNSDPSACLG
jgi:hypothetical protein